MEQDVHLIDGRSFNRLMVMTRSRIVVLCTLISVGAHVNGFAQIRSELHATGLTLPVAFIQDPTNPAVQFVVQQGGLIRVVQNGNVLATPFLDVSGLISCCGEQGLFSLAFPPDTATSRRFYISYTNPSGHSVISRYQAIRCQSACGRHINPVRSRMGFDRQCALHPKWTGHES